MKLGLCPIGKFVFSHEDALVQKREIEERLRRWGIPFAGIDAAVPDGVIRGTADVEPAIAQLRGQGVDAVFLPHCNFGTEHAVGLVAKGLGVPALVWGPRDEAPLADGTRLRDSLCGMFASTKILRKLGVPFTYIENCRIDAPPFREGLETFVRAADVANVFRKGVRVGQVGQRIDFFWSTIVNESELLDRFNVEVLPIDLVSLLKRAASRAAKENYTREEAELRSRFQIEGLGPEPLARVLAFRDELLEVAAAERLDAVAVQDFMSVAEDAGAWCSLASSFVSERLPYGMETDIHGALSDLMLRRASGGGTAFVVDLTARHPENDNAVLLWHFGAPLSLRHPDAQVRVGKHWILPTPYSGMTHFQLRDGDLTIARFDGERGEYALALGEGRTTPGPRTLNNYAWLEVDNWPRWERKLMEGPFPHHAGMVHGHCAAALAEACKYIPGLVRPVPLNSSGGNGAASA